jgi:hypothetical protein
MTMNRYLKDFREGFVGAFVLAGAIVMALVSVASAFAHGGADALRGRDGHRAARP